jgi:hypothetical protein
MDATDPITTTAPSPPTLTGEAKARARRLRGKIDEFVGIAFYGELLKATRNSSLQGEYGHGGRGEEVFAGQLHMELAQQAGRARRSPLTDAIYRKLIDGTRRAARQTEAQRLRMRQNDDFKRTLGQHGSARAADAVGAIPYQAAPGNSGRSGPVIGRGQGE